MSPLWLTVTSLPFCLLLLLPGRFSPSPLPQFPLKIYLKCLSPSLGRFPWLCSLSKHFLATPTQHVQSYSPTGDGTPWGHWVLTTGRPPGKSQHCPFCIPLWNEFKCPFPVPPTPHESSASSLTQLITQYCSFMFTCWLKGILHGGKGHFFFSTSAFFLTGIMPGTVWVLINVSRMNSSAYYTTSPFIWPLPLSTILYWLIFHIYLQQSQ